MDLRAPYKPEAIEAESGAMGASMKGRGIGDCWSTNTWQFDGKTFVLTEETRDGMCRGFPGGAWQLPAYVSKVAAEDKAKR